MQSNAVQLPIARPPQHVAIIMDGNGRWAAARSLPRTAGHRKGADAVRRSVRAAAEFGVRYLTLFGFSTENWRRPVAEIDDLMGLLRRYLRSEIADLHGHDVRVRVIGERAALPTDIVGLITQVESMTAGNGGLTFTVALSYGGRQELTSAARALAREVRDGTLAPQDIDEACIARHLSTHGMPDPDLLIRTSGEQRLSNFMLWQLAYAELVFIDVLWPDFDRGHFEAAIREYKLRERRFGTCVG